MCLLRSYVICRIAHASWRGLGWRAALALCAVAFFACGMASAQDKGILNPQPLPPLAKPDDPNTPARELFGRKTTPTALPTRSIGFYSKGCLAGAVALPVNGETWQVMRLSRNRNWGHPSLVEFLEQLSEHAARSGWPGLLLGDMSRPRGGPMFNGLSLPKTRFEHSDGVVRQGPDTRQCLRTVRRAVCRAHPYRAKRGFEPHCNRSRISRGFAEGAQR